MAQWLGQYSGLTHATKVADLEASLRLAVASLRSAGSAHDRGKKAKAVRRLAERLLTARLKWLKAHIAAAEDAQTREPLAGRANEVAILKRKDATTREGGLDAVLNEFGADDAHVTQ